MYNHYLLNNRWMKTTSGKSDDRKRCIRPKLL